ncbi:MAG: DUF6438 domain-containing protein [Bacteroidota bacterium]
MRKNTLVVLVILSLYACATNKNEDKVSLEGDWVLIQDTTKIFSGSDVGLRFAGDTISSLGNPVFLPQSPYRLKQDTIFFKDINGAELSYYILNHTPDSLILSRNGHTENYYNRQLEYNPDLELDSTILKTGWCFGECPNFTMVVHQDGTVHFEGFEHTKVVGKKELKMEKESLDKLDSLFKWSYIDHLDTTRNYGAIDGWSTYITFHYNERNTAKVNGTMMEMPFRLSELIAELTNFLQANELI